MLFQENDGLRCSVYVVPFSPDLEPSAFPLTELCFDIDQPPDLNRGVIAAGNPGNVDMLAFKGGT